MRRPVFLAALAAPLTPRNAEATETPVRIAVLGDSLALGTGATRGDRGFIFRAYRDLLRRRPRSVLDTFAIGGSTVADVLRLQVARLRDEHYDIVVVCVGGNDVVRRTAAADFSATYDRVLGAVRQVVPRARIVCCGIPNVALSPIFADEHAAVAALAAADDRAVRVRARSSASIFVDLYHATTQPVDRFLSADRFHPSDRGYALLATAFAPALARAAGA